MKDRRPLLVVLAVAAFAVSAFASGVADRERCRGAVLATKTGPLPEETIEGALARVAPGGRWTVEARESGTRSVTYVAGDDTFAWVCTPHSVPLVEPESEKAKELTPWSAAP